MCLFLIYSSPPPAKFDHQLVRAASLVLGSPLHFQPLLSVTVQLQSLLGVPSAGTSTSDDGVRRHGIRREAVRLRPVHLRLQARQLPAQPQAHPQDRRLQVGTRDFYPLPVFGMMSVKMLLDKTQSSSIMHPCRPLTSILYPKTSGVTFVASPTPTTCPCATTCESTVRSATCAICAGRPSA